MRILVASDRPVVSNAVAEALRSHTASTVREQLGGVAECMKAVRYTAPDLAVVDIRLPAAERRRLCAHLKASGILTVLLIDFPEEALGVLEAGVDGVVMCSDGLAGVLTAVDMVAAGHTHVPSALVGPLLQHLIERRRGQGGSVGVDRLSTRERQVLSLLGEGLDQAAIARRLGISPQTAKTHIRHVMTKLGVRSRIAAAAIASDLGHQTLSQ